MVKMHRKKDRCLYISIDGTVEGATNMESLGIKPVWIFVSEWQL